MASRWIRRSWPVVRSVTHESGQDRVLGLAAEMAFFTVLGIFPGLLIAIGLLGVLDTVVGEDLAAGVEQQIVTSLQTVLTGKASAVVGSVQDLFGQSRGQLLTVASLGGLVTVSGAFAVVIEALNLAYGTTEHRSWIRRRLLGLLMGIATLVAAVLALAVLVVGPLLGTGEELARLVGLGSAFSTTWAVLRYPVVVIGLVLWATAVFHIAPNRPSRWQKALPGAYLTTVLWIVASLGLHVYLAIAVRVNPVIGAFGGGVIVMVWVYLLCVALLLGGELNAVLERGAGHDRTGARSRAPSL